MEKIYEELDEAKAEIEKLKEKYKVKVDLCESLKRANNEQLVKVQKTSSEVERLIRELCEKEEEISFAKQLYEDLMSSFKEKEAFAKQLASGNDKLRAKCDDKVQRYEEENRMLALALEDTNTKNADLEQQIRLLEGQIEGLKELSVSASRKKNNSEMEKATKISKELRQRDNAFLSLEEQNRKFEDQLKWKKEQFNHLEEAYEKLRHQVKVKEKEWGKERDELLDEISKLQENLDAQIRTSEGLQNRLQMCNQALAHEESKRKYLQVQLSESKKSFDNVLADYEEAKSMVENLTAQRDNEIASLRDMLGTKEMLYKETEYQLKRLEMEKQELVLSLEEFREARIQETGSSSSLSKLRNKLQALEKLHGECLMNLKAKEAEWQSRSEKLMVELDQRKLETECKDISIQQLKEKVENVRREHASILEDHEAKWNSKMEGFKKDLGVCRSELENRNTTIRELEREVEACDSLILQLELQNEETSLMFLVLKSEFAEAKLRLADENRAGMDLKNKEIIEERLSLLCKQLEIKDTALVKAQNDIEEEREKVACLAGKVEELNLIGEEQVLLQNKLAKQNEMVNESYTCQLHLEEQLLSMKRDLSNVRYTLDRANNELTDTFCEASEAEFELHIWKSIAENLKSSLEENREMRREVEASLLAEAEIEFNLKQETESLMHVIEEKEKIIDSLKEEISVLKQELDTENQEWLRKEIEGAIFTQVVVDTAQNQEQKRIDDLQKLVRSLEKEFKSSTSSFAGRLSEMQVEIDMFHKAWEKMTQMEVMKEMEIQLNNLIMSELEIDLNHFQEEVAGLRKSLHDSEQRREELTMIIEEDRSCSSSSIRSSSSSSSSELEKNLLSKMKGLSDRISMLSGDGMQLVGTLTSLVQIFDDNDVKMKGVYFDPVKENMEDDAAHATHASASPNVTKKASLTILEQRSPLRALNN